MSGGSCHETTRGAGPQAGAGGAELLPPTAGAQPERHAGRGPGLPHTGRPLPPSLAADGRKRGHPDLRLDPNVKFLNHTGRQPWPRSRCRGGRIGRRPRARGSAETPSGGLKPPPRRVRRSCVRRTCRKEERPGAPQCCRLCLGVWDVLLVCSGHTAPLFPRPRLEEAAGGRSARYQPQPLQLQLPNPPKGTRGFRAGDGDPHARRPPPPAGKGLGSPQPKLGTIQPSGPGFPALSSTDPVPGPCRREGDPSTYLRCPRQLERGETAPEVTQQVCLTPASVRMCGLWSGGRPWGASGGGPSPAVP